MSTDKAKNEAKEERAAAAAARPTSRERSQPYAAEAEDYRGETVVPPRPSDKPAKRPARR